MTSFARYYENKKLVNVSMAEIESLITDSNNKEKVANLIYHRYYERYLKIFFYESKEKDSYQDDKGNTNTKNVFKTEYVNGFIMMGSCCLLIETLSAFIEGNDKTPKGAGKTPFETVFNKAHEYSNDLQVFRNNNFYNNVRCGILHQGETYGSFKVRRTGKLYDKSELTINATKFTIELNSFLKSFANELKVSKWDGRLWDNCRSKLRHIVNNSKNQMKSSIP